MPLAPARALLHLQNLLFLGPPPTCQAHLRCKAGLAEESLGDATFDDLGLSNKDVHQVSARHEVKEEIQVVLVLEAGVLSYTKGVGCVPGDRLLAHHVLWTLHHRCLPHLFEGILPLRALLCRQELGFGTTLLLAGSRHARS